MQRRTFLGIGLSLLAPTAAQPWATAAETARPRPLAPGVLTVIPPAPLEEETSAGPLPLVELTTGRPELNWTPNFTPVSQTLLGKASTVTLRREIWNLQFSFKPLRMIYVDVPQPSGKMQRKLIWYLMYRITYPGGDMKPVTAPDSSGHQMYTIEGVSYDSRRFFPHLVLQSRELGKSYLDRVIPTAMEPIVRRESPGVRVYNSVDITKVEIPLSDERVERGIWGLATWEDIDPRIDFFSVFVRNLTNAYVFEDPPGAYKAGDPPGSGREIRVKTLQLNFWRPGDTLHEHEGEVRYGVPIDANTARQQAILEKYGISSRLDHLWVYR